MSVQNVVFNGSEVALEIDIEFGALKTSVFVQPKGRATIEVNYQVTPLFLKLNPAVRQTSKAEFEAQKVMLTSRASYFPTSAAVVPAVVSAAKSSADSSTATDTKQIK